MKVSVQKVARRNLDVETRPFRQAGMDKHPTQALLRAVRKALRIRSQEIATRMGTTQSAVFDMEKREARGTITLKSIARLAEAMDCKMVYGVVPKGGRTLEGLYQERLWAVVLGTGIRE
jgi:predicted DNA-binding mobile mystery protein A